MNSQRYVAAYLPGVPLTFTVRTFPTTLYNTKNDYDVANSRIVVNSANAIYSSTDGINWTAGTYPTTSTQSNVLRIMGGVFYTGHQGTLIYYSATGTSGYTTVSSGLTNQTHYDFMKSGANYIIANSQDIRTSTIGTSTYTTRSASGTRGLAKNPSTNRIVAVGGSGGMTISTSDDDGITWTTPRQDFTATGGQFASVVWFPAGNCFIGVWGHFDGVSAKGKIYKIDSTGATSVEVFALNNNYLVSVGVDAKNNAVFVSGLSGVLYRSTDTTTWTAVTTGTTANLGGVTWMPNLNMLMVHGYQTTTYITGV